AHVSLDPAPRAQLFPYTTLFRSVGEAVATEVKCGAGPLREGGEEIAVEELAVEQVAAVVVGLAALPGAHQLAAHEDLGVRVADGMGPADVAGTPGGG